MKLIQESTLVIREDRQRTTLDAEYISDLAASIEANGLIHAPVVEGDEKTLVAGECRSRAMMLLHSENRPFKYAGKVVIPHHIPVVPMGELTEIEREEIELEENVKRKDLAISDKARAVKRLHDLRQKQAVAKGEVQTMQKTAAELFGLAVAEMPDSRPKEVRDLLIIADNLDIPGVKEASTKKEALKLIEKTKKAEYRERLSNEFLAIKTAHVIDNADSLEWLKDLASSTFDIILTDPPYGVNADEFNSQAANPHDYQDTIEYAETIYEALAVEGYRVAKDQAHAYVFCDVTLFFKWKAVFEKAGWSVWPRPLIWFKGGNVGMLTSYEYGPRNSYEAILFANKGKKKVQTLGPDVFNVPGLNRPTFGAQKPVDIYSQLLLRSIQPGDHVLDPFCGAGGSITATSKLQGIMCANELNKDKVNYIITEVLPHLTDVSSVEAEALDELSVDQLDQLNSLLLI